LIIKILIIAEVNITLKNLIEHLIECFWISYTFSAKNINILTN
jgi:hypothetical protein